MKLDHTAFFNGYRAAYGALGQGQVNGLESLLAQIELDPDLADPRWAAYMLATVKHECADTYQPVVERGARSYFDKYESGTNLGKQLGNTNPGDGYLFRGRGYVQITGRANYQSMTGKLRLSGNDDLVQHPDSALEPGVAYRIMSYGMRKGSFTGKKLADYITAGGTDYLQARRIINGLDRADTIKGYAVAFESILRGSIAP
jgi:putative chitinase